MIKFYIIIVAVCVLFGCGGEQVKNNNKQVTIDQQDILEAELSNDAKHLFVYSAQPAITMWDTSTGIQIWRLDDQMLNQPIKTFTHTSKYKLLAVASSNIVKVWNYDQKSLFGELFVKGYNDLASISVLSFSNHSKQLFVGMTDGSISVFDLASRTATRTLKHDNNVAFISPDDENARILYSAAHDGKLFKWNTATGEDIFSVELPSRITSMGLGEEHIFISDGLKSQLVINMITGEKISQLNYFSRFRWFRQAIFYEKDGWRLITTSSKEKITVWDVTSGKEIDSWSIHSLGLGSTVLDAKILDETLITISSDGIIEFMDL